MPQTKSAAVQAPKIVTFAEGDTHAGICACGYKTSGWPKRTIAAERIQQHRKEHQTGEPMELLSEFRGRHGLVSAGNRAVFPDGAKEVK